MKKFPTKFFRRFDPNGHSYYLGKYKGDIDMYWLFEPLQDCNCCSEMKESTSTLIFYQLLLRGLKEGLSNQRLANRNVVITEDYENLKSFNFTEFLLDDFFNSDYNIIQDRLWADLGQFEEFFVTHKPILAFTKFGQNIRIEHHTIWEQLELDFNLHCVNDIKVSVASNIMHMNIPENENTNPIEKDTLEDDYVAVVLSSTPPAGSYSLGLSADGVRKFVGNGDVKLYTKAFNPAFSNFNANGSIPRALRGIETVDVKIDNTIGYSTASHYNRRSSHSEPFYGRPIANLMKATTTSSIEKFSDLIEKSNRDLKGALSMMGEVGTDYRIEVTLAISFRTAPRRSQERIQEIERIKVQLMNVVYEFEIRTLNSMYRYGLGYPVTIFPGLVCSYTEFLMDGLKPLLSRNPKNLTIEQKEYAVILENLVT